MPTASRATLHGDSEVGDILQRATLVEIRSCVDDAANDSVLLAMKFDTSHWVCLVVDNANNKLQLYDSMTKRAIAKVLKTMATEMVSAVLDGEYEVATLKTPHEKDGDSCGVFVCLRSWGQGSSDAPDGVSPGEVMRLHWEMLRAVIKMKRNESTTP
ncbi:unnamed protein product [Phytophthora fragariaefolia]|uniref:Unnamed protein product n=1 Tax=Phytophthora fragariaefolia TaxID=1490495 RepID=A0A9W7CLH1_9STRA|nr:unnamed protein product [Phytophthora fragariaefolia]